MTDQAAKAHLKDALPFRKFGARKRMSRGDHITAWLDAGAHLPTKTKSGRRNNDAARRTNRLGARIRGSGPPPGNRELPDCPGCVPMITRRGFPMPSRARSTRDSRGAPRLARASRCIPTTAPLRPQSIASATLRTPRCLQLDRAGTLSRATGKIECDGAFSRSRNDHDLPLCHSGWRLVPSGGAFLETVCSRTYRRRGTIGDTDDTQ